MVIFGRPSRRGVTLTELLFALCILMLALSALGKVLVSGYTSSATVNDQNYVQQEAQRMADRIVDSMRGASAFAAGSATSVTALFKNGDTVRYSVSRPGLFCDRTSGTTHTRELICPDMVAFNVTFYSVHGNDWNTPPLTLAEARAARVSVTLDLNNTHATESSAVKLRNKL